MVNVPVLVHIVSKSIDQQLFTCEGKEGSQNGEERNEEEGSEKIRWILSVRLFWGRA